MKFSLATLGCKQNQYESDALRDMLEWAGFEAASPGEKAGLCLINTCTVTAKADLESRQLIRRAIRSNTGALVVVTGCYAQVSPEAVRGIPGVDLVLGNSEKAEILYHLRNLQKAPVPQVWVKDVSSLRRFDDLPAPRRPDRTRAFLKVQDGCNYSCSFCIVPEARGRSRSQDPEAVLERVKELSAAGYPEVVFTGIHLGSYGQDLKPPASLTDLVRRVIKVEGLGRLRLSSLDPHEVEEGLIRLFKDLPKLCRHLHLPLQSGDDQILRLMRRTYDAGTYRKLVMDLTLALPDLAIGADVIVGFPQETEECFRNTYHLLEDLPLAYLHVFSYSRREGTAAAAMPGQIPARVKAERGRMLRTLSQKKSLEFRSRFLGKVREVVVLSKRDGESGLLRGLTDNYIEILFPGEDALMNRVVPLEITGVEAEATYGRPS
ncbi:MAG: tRNA (N(6)-L-threonylcarbamoyladenosine(37)-C(2))-methylthiotransferase MtaB [candidate division NC10 bacterium]|nr:tRNA (N(6)-L-threonylcarbamoyladenosine(37)-C(2))-methylthiotransferase MtaB [candidate division NC10 bacterium]